ncbi:hypothetical protein [Desulfopila aestuarii]|uniref:Uncharacterized protein n=1 Tax=Desulfopila aestuarii DSM 18488 TaxID=1121416 RepID=A0A1M7YK28_9BACT|nr:hypothetical protein [Desulfopila aestuarii]SHO52888.1 hypothetical protein SAMN02745220_04822 [Desulfopila aestuarii DSM 18488]
MTASVKNLTDPEEIIHEFLIKDSRYAISRFADNSGFSRPYISQHIHGHRKNRQLLQMMADHLGCGIYGVMPNKKMIGNCLHNKSGNMAGTGRRKE